MMQSQPEDKVCDQARDQRNADAVGEPIVARGVDERRGEQEEDAEYLRKPPGKQQGALLAKVQAELLSAVRHK